MNTSSKTEIIYAFLIVVFVFVLYGNSINHDYNFDDEYVILNEQVQQGIKAVPEIFTSRYFTSEDQTYGYRPITKMTYAIEFSIFGLNPKVSHLLNVLLYCLTGLLLFYFLVKYFNNYPKWVWLLATGLFLSHPLHTEVVSSLKNREEILSFLFGLIGIIAAFRYAKYASNLWLIIGFSAISISILTKESGVIFLGFMIIYLAINKLKAIESKRLGLPKIPEIKSPFSDIDPFLILSLITFILMVIFTFFKPNHYVTIINQAICSITSVLIINYKIFYQKKQLFQNPKNNIIWLIFSLAIPLHFEKIGQLIYFLTVIYILGNYSIILFRMNKQTLSYTASYILKILAILIGSFILVSSVFFLFYILPQQLLSPQEIKLDLNQTPLTYVEDSWAFLKLSGEAFTHYINQLIFPEKLLFYYGYNTIPIPENLNLNLAFFGFFVLVLTFALFLIKQSKPAFLFIFFLLAGIVFFSNLLFDVPGIVGDRLMYLASLGFCGLLALGFYEIYKIKGKFFKVVSLFSATFILVLYSFKTISRNLAWQNKSTLYSSDIGHLENSARANMIYADLLFGQAQKKLTENNTIEATEMFEASAFYYERSLKVDSSNFTAYNNLGTIYFSFLNKKQKAKSILQKGLTKRFVNYYAYNNLGMIYEELQKPDSAEIYFKQAIELNSTNIEANFGMARVLHQQNKLDEAFTFYVKVLEKNPTEIEAHEKMGDLLLQMNDTSNAIRFYQNVLKINSSRIDVTQKIENLSL